MVVESSVDDDGDLTYDDTGATRQAIKVRRVVENFYPIVICSMMMGGEMPSVRPFLHLSK